MIFIKSDFGSIENKIVLVLHPVFASISKRASCMSFRTFFKSLCQHMARLYDASRQGRGGYSLEGLSADFLSRRKLSMKDLFGAPMVLSH
jgi:hypothetical protein